MRLVKTKWKGLTIIYVGFKIIVEKNLFNFFYYREYPIRTDVIFQSNKFQAYHLKPLGQSSFFFRL